MNLKLVLGVIIAAVLFIFGVIFALASAYSSERLFVSIVFFVVGFGILYVVTRKPNVRIQRLELSGRMKAVPLKCPNCSASLKSDKIRIISGVPYATCDYCNHTFEIVEEPKW